MKRIFSTALVLASAFIVNADTHTWKTSPEVDYSDWDNPASYVEGTKPEEGDIVILPSNGETVYLSDSDMSSFELASKLAQIKPVHSWSVTGRVVFTISNPMSSLKFNSMITYDPDSKSALQPIIVKKGAGELELANATKGSAYRADIYVDEGILKLSQGSTGATLTVGDLSVSNGASFFTANCGFTVCDRLYCDGLIANTSGADQYFRPNGNGGIVTERGRLAPNIRWYAGGRVDILSEENTMSAYTTAYNGGMTGLKKIGKSGEVSSSGTCNSLRVAEYGGGFVYLGEGEETDKSFYAQNPAQGPFVFDGGANGGLVFLAESYIGISGGGAGHCILQGDNAENPCVFNGRVTASNDGNAINLTKRGKGTWRFGPYSTWRNDRTGLATISVEDGSLQFEQLYAAGEQGSFGTGTVCYTVGCYGSDAEAHEEYKFAFGSPDNADAAPVFELVGTNNVLCYDRPAVLRGNATIKNSSSDSEGNPKAFRFSGISSIVQNDVELTLDGAGEENVVSCVSENGTGRISLCKKGSGVWTLSGTNSFTGTLRVKEGRMVVKSEKKPYEWFRFTVRSCRINDVGYTPAEPSLAFALLGIFDSDGNRLNGGLTRCREYTEVKPGEFAYWQHGRNFIEPSGWECEKLFCDTRSNGLVCKWKNAQGAYVPVIGTDRSTWVSLVMRLPSDAGAVDSYDFTSAWATDWVDRQPKSWVMEGSRDGLLWDELHSVEDGGEKAAYRWYSTGKEMKKDDSAANHTGGFKIGGVATSFGTVLDPSASIRVDEGSQLVADGEIDVGGLVVDANGAGVVDGFSFLPNGTLNVLNMPKSGMAILPGTYRNVSGFSHVGNWTLEIDGAAASKHSISVSDGGVLRIVPVGFRFTVR
jgi:autotransporter-associated beta strand protein